MKLIGFAEEIEIEFDAFLEEEDDIGAFLGKKILVGEQLNNDERRSTLLHEILHYCCNFTGHEISEDAIEGISNSLYAIIKMNRQLFIDEVLPAEVWDT